MNRRDEPEVLMHATAIRMQVSRLYGEGWTMDEAKESAINGYSMGIVPKRLRGDVVNVVNLMDATDVHPYDFKKSGDSIYADVVARGFIKDRWYQRLLWKWFRLFV